jgi:hypothetical protein
VLPQHFENEADRLHARPSRPVRCTLGVDCRHLNLFQSSVRQRCQAMLRAATKTFFTTGGMHAVIDASMEPGSQPITVGAAKDKNAQIYASSALQRVRLYLDSAFSDVSQLLPADFATCTCLWHCVPLHLFMLELLPTASSSVVARLNRICCQKHKRFLHRSSGFPVLETHHRNKN